MKDQNQARGFLRNALLGSWLEEHKLPEQPKDPEELIEWEAQKASLTTEFEALTETDAVRRSAEEANQLATIYANAGSQLLGLSYVAGQAFLQLLWEVQQQGLFLFAGKNGAEYNNLVEWSSSNIVYHDMDYVRSMARVVERMFSDIQQRVESGDPYIVTKDGQVVTRQTIAAQNDGELPTRKELLAMGEVLTPESLITMPNTVARLKESSFAYQESDPGQRAALLSTIITAAQPETFKSKLDDVQNGSGATLYRPVIENRSDGLCNLSLEGLTATDLHVALRLLRPIARRN